ncbi:MAG: hypothetical protein Ct9H90mP20_6740 [Candidatus Neomarinimicrobiota bacterium]|nr:MAG: hypothetical protein Ct9H90mP20_6740 [Candidatus Neomarinimicrobiota bacterium]
MKFPSPHSLKMACGENPKRVYGNGQQALQQEGENCRLRKAWIEAGGLLKSIE